MSIIIGAFIPVAYSVFNPVKVTLGQVPLQDTDAACEEASRAMKSGHVGIQIGNHVGPMDLDADELIAFLQHCAEDEVGFSCNKYAVLDLHFI